ncbi:MAG TPA: hypothetical protein VHI54_12335 [Actinomycetota bacterium]|nr:hypothetical protein [Actinomycetota bacterium]
MDATTDRTRQEIADPRSTRSFPLWFGVLGPPLAWLTHLLLGDLIYELGCAPAMRAKEIFGLSLHTWTVGATIALLAVTIAGGLLAFRALRRLLAESDGAPLDRATGMAFVGVASSVLYGLIQIFGLLPSLVLPPCLPSPP